MNEVTTYSFRLANLWMLQFNYCELLVQRSLCWTLGNIAEFYTKLMHMCG